MVYFDLVPSPVVVGEACLRQEPVVLKVVYFDLVNSVIVQGSQSPPIASLSDASRAGSRWHGSGANEIEPKSCYGNRPGGNLVLVPLLLIRLSDAGHRKCTTRLNQNCCTGPRPSWRRWFRKSATGTDSKAIWSQIRSDHPMVPRRVSWESRCGPASRL